jgi:hypothetical protein
MAILYVRDTGLLSASGASSVSGNFSGLPAVGNHVFQQASWWGSSGTTMVFSDNQSGNSWVNNAQEPTDVGQTATAIGSAKVVGSAGTFGITGTGGASSYFHSIGVEFSGINATSHLDQNGHASPLAGSSITVTATSANSQADALVLAVMGTGGNGANINIATPTGGYTRLAVDQDSTTIVAFEARYKIASAGETSSTTWTHDNLPTESASAVLVTYKPSAGGGGGNNPPSGRTVIIAG